MLVASECVFCLVSLLKNVHDIFIFRAELLATPELSRSGYGSFDPSTSISGYWWIVCLMRYTSYFRAASS